MKSIYILFSILILFNNELYASWTQDTLPNPTTNGSYIANPDSILKQNTVQTIDLLVSTHKKETENEVAVVVVNSIGQSIPKDFAVDIFNKWGVGKKGKDNGVLLLVVMDQRRFEIEVGYGLEGELSDVKAGRIVHDIMIPTIRSKDVDAAVLLGVESIINILNKDPEGNRTSGNGEFIGNPLTGSEDDIDFYVGVSIIFAAVVMCGLFIIFLINRLIWFSTLSLRDLVNSKGPDSKNIEESQPSSFSRLKDFEDENNNEDTETVSEKTLRKEKPKRRVNEIVIKSFSIQENTLSIIFKVFILCIIGADVIAFTISVPLFVFSLIYSFFIMFYCLSIETDKRKKIINYIFSKPDKLDLYNEKIIFFPLVVALFITKKIITYQRKKLEVTMQKQGFNFLSEEDELRHLNENEELEEKIGSKEYDIFENPLTGKFHKTSRDIPFSGYDICTQCGTKAYKLLHDKILQDSTYSAVGKGKKTYECKFCSYKHEEEYMIQMKSSSSSSSRGSSGYSSSSSSSSSFGGGRSGGGGAGGSW